MPQDLSLLALGVDPDELGETDPFVSRQLADANSYVSSHAGEIVEKITTNDARWMSLVLDFSHSTDAKAIRDAFRLGYTVMMQEKLAKSSIRRSLMVQRVHYGSTVEEIHPFDNLVRIDPTTKSTELNIPLLPADFEYLGGTATLDALEKALADQRAMERVSAPDLENIASEHTVLLFTDGRVNVSLALQKAKQEAIDANQRWTDADTKTFLEKQVRDVRRFIKLRNEKWSFMAFCTVEPYVAEVFLQAMQQTAMSAQFMTLIRQRLDERLQVINLLPVENRPSVMPTLESEAANLMYETMMSGWGFYVEDADEIDKMSDEGERTLAQLYREAEGVIVNNIERSYFTLGGLGLKRQNVLTVTHNADAVLELIGTHMSSSVIRQAGGSQTAIAVNLTPQGAKDEENSAF